MVDFRSLKYLFIGMFPGPESKTSNRLPDTRPGKKSLRGEHLL